MMEMKIWKQKAGEALDILNELLTIWENRDGEFAFHIEHTGRDANDAVIELKAILSEVSLPLPYQAKKMSQPYTQAASSIAMTREQRAERNQKDKNSQNIRAWIRAIEDFSLRIKGNSGIDDAPQEQKASTCSAKKVEDDRRAVSQRA